VAVATHGFCHSDAEVLSDGGEVRVYLEGAAERRGSLSGLAEGEVTEPLA
jgi:hypothetical protein